MMKLRYLALVVLGAFVVALASSCAGPPNEEIAQADAAIQGAQAAGADLYAADDFKAAQDALAEAKSKVESKDYKGAKEAAMTAKEKAEMAKTNAEKGKEEKKAEAESKMAALKTEWESVKAESGKMKGKAAEEMKMMVSDMEASVTAIQGQIDQGAYADAVKALDETTMKAQDMKTKMMEAGKGKKK